MALLMLWSMAGDVRASLAPAWLSQHYTEKPLSVTLLQTWPCGCQDQVSDLFLMSQPKDGWDDDFCTRESHSEGLPCEHLTGFLKSPPAPKLLHYFFGGG